MRGWRFLEHFECCRFNTTRVRHGICSGGPNEKKNSEAPTGTSRLMSTCGVRHFRKTACFGTYIFRHLRTSTVLPFLGVLMMFYYTARGERVIAAALEISLDLVRVFQEQGKLRGAIASKSQSLDQRSVSLAFWQKFGLPFLIPVRFLYYD